MKKYLILILLFISGLLFAGKGDKYEPKIMSAAADPAEFNKLRRLNVYNFVF